MKAFLPTLLFLALGPGLLHAQSESSSTPPAGYAKLQIAGRRDTLLSLPLPPDAIAAGKIVTATPNSVSLDGAGWTPNQFQPIPNGATWYAEFSSGALEGVICTVTGNTADTLVLDTGGENLLLHRRGAVAAGDVVRVRPHTTIGQIFGATTPDFVLSLFATMPTAAQMDTEDGLLFPDNVAAGWFKAPARRLIGLDGAGWRVSGDSATDHGADPLLPGGVVRVRRQGLAPVELLLLGHTVRNGGLVRLSGGNGALGNDTTISLLGSAPVTLDASGLYNADPVVSVIKASPGELDREDEVHVFTGAKAGFGLLLSLFQLLIRCPEEPLKRNPACLPIPRARGLLTLLLTVSDFRHVRKSRPRRLPICRPVSRPRAR